MKKYSLFLLVFCAIAPVFAHSFDNIAYENRTYVKGITSVKLIPADAPLGFPIIELNSGQQLRLVFDDLENDDSRYLKYTFIHCTHDWKPSGLNQFDYLDGFFEDELNTHSYSFNTIQSYVHFELLFPNDLMRIKLSGNYLLVVYDDNPDNPILTRRFLVREAVGAPIEGYLHAASDVQYRERAQEVDFKVYTGNYVIHNPSQYLSATIIQNNRWDNAIIGLRYRFGKPGEYDFNYDENQNCFFGSSEFRVFSLKSLHYTPEHVASISFRNNTNYALIMEDIARPFGAYQGTPTLKGKCYWENTDFSGENREDYVKTVFSLKCEFPVTDGDLYVFGELTDWQIKDEAKLEYNELSGYWEASLYIKQGYYNYQYVYIKHGTTDIDATYIEGSHWETNNDYGVFVYLFDEASLYDRLIGAEFFTTVMGK